MKARNTLRALALVIALLASLMVGSGPANAASDYDALLKVSPTLYVYTDGATKSQKMDISQSWFSDLGQTYAKRVQQNMGWPTNFMTELDAIQSSGSLGIAMSETPDGNVIHIFGTRDPNGYCGFVGDAATGSYQCSSHAGYGYVRASYFTHNSYGGNGCWSWATYSSFCSDNGMAIYQTPIVQTGTAGYQIIDLPNTQLSSYTFYYLHFDLTYPNGYAGTMIPTLPPPAKYVAMGDSFSGGEGNEPFEAGTNESGVNECHRSTQAYPRLLQNTLALGPTAFVACGGATTADVALSGQWNAPKQTTTLSSTTNKVTLTIGGNDVGLSSYILGCTVTCGPGTPVYTAMIDGINQPAFKENLKTTYEEVLAKAPVADVYVADYPYLATPVALIRCLGFDFSGAYSVEAALNSMIQSAVDEVRASNTRIHYVSVNYSGSPFTGGELCNETGDNATSLFYGFNALHSSYSFHPNAMGQAAYARVFEGMVS